MTSWLLLVAVVLLWIWLGVLLRGWLELRRLVAELRALERLSRTVADVSFSERQQPLE